MADITIGSITVPSVAESAFARCERKASPMRSRRIDLEREDQGIRRQRILGSRGD
jgi:hypothetical protein